MARNQARDLATPFWRKGRSDARRRQEKHIKMAGAGDDGGSD